MNENKNFKTDVFHLNLVSLMKLLLSPTVTVKTPEHWLISLTTSLWANLATFWWLTAMRQFPETKPTLSAGLPSITELKIHGFWPESVNPKPNFPLATSTVLIPEPPRFFLLLLAADAAAASRFWSKVFRWKPS